MPTIPHSARPESTSIHTDWFIHQRSAWLLLLPGMILTIVAFFAVKSYEQQNIQKTFENEANRLRIEVQQRFYIIEKELRALAAWTGTTDSINSENFHEFIAGLHSTSLSHSVHGYGLLDSGFSYPVKLIEPIAQNHAALGLDISSEPLFARQTNIASNSKRQ